MTRFLWALIGPGGREPLYMPHSKKGHTFFLSPKLSTGTAWSAMTRRMQIEIQTLC